MKIEKNKNYVLRFLPNLQNPVASSLGLLFTCTTHGSQPVKKYISYVLGDLGKADTLVFGNTLHEYMNHCIQGFYGTSEGYMLSENYIDRYWANDDKSIITVDNWYKNKHEFAEYTDIHYYEKINLFDIKSPYSLSFKTSEEHGFMKITNLRFVDTGALYKNGDDKEDIFKLWDGVRTLEESLEEYKKEMIIRGNENNIKYLFDQEAQSFYASPKIAAQIDLDKL